MDNSVLFKSFVIFIPIFIILFMGTFYINDFRGGGSVLFGIRVPKEYINDERLLNIKKKYKRNMAIICSILFILFCILSISSSLILGVLISVLGFILLSGILYYSSYKKVLEIKNKENWTILSSKKVILDISVERENIMLSLWWYVIPFAIAIIGFLIVLYNINDLPNQVALHFGFNGPDEFGAGNDINSKLQVLFLPLLSIMVLCISFFSVKGMKNKSQRINGGSVEEVKVRNTNNKKYTSIMMLIISLIISIWMFLLSLITLEFIPYSLELMFIPMAILLGIMLVFMILYIKDNKRKENIDNEEIYIDDDNPYKLGGLFYYSKTDPRVWVEKRSGLGYTVNFATIGGKIFLVIIVAIIFLPAFF